MSAIAVASVACVGSTTSWNHCRLVALASKGGTFVPAHPQNESSVSTPAQVKIVHSVSAARQAIGPPDTEGRICRLLTRTTSSIKQNVYIFNIPFTVHFVRFNFVDGLGPFQTFSQCLFSFLR